MATQQDDKKHQDVEATKPNRETECILHISELIRGHPLYYAIVNSNAPESNKAGYPLDD